ISPWRTAVGTGVAEGQSRTSVGPASDDWPMVRCHGLQLYGCCTAYEEFFVRHLGWQPGIFVSVLQASGLGTKTLDKQVLVVRIAVSHAPGDVRRVAKVRRSRHTGHGIATDAERGAGEVDLIVDAGRIEGPMRIAGQQGEPRGRARPRDDPGVAATVHFAEPVELGRHRREFVQAI